ncbi:MAG: amidase [Burkholderiales bacterium]|nr:amidase [Burkholderiales bacterium]
MSHENDYSQLSALDAREAMVAGRCACVDYAQALLARVDRVEPEVRAWARIDADHLLAQAREADSARAAGQTCGALFGLPVGIKDIIDTADLPTEDGTPLHAGRQPDRDATVVRRLREAGGLVMGKTVTTEFATYAPGPTRNPRDPRHTPGGSSSGSAAAVAAAMTPLAIGTQTNGSVIRPASFCGVYGFKPGAGWISRRGVLTQSPTLDAIGVFGRTLGDVALLAQALAGHDPDDGQTWLRAAPRWVEMAAAEPPLAPTLAWVETPFWDRVAPDARAAFGELVELLAGRIAPFELPAQAAQAIAWHRTVMEVDIAASFGLDHDRGRDRMSASLRGQIERGRRITAVDYREALARVPRLLAALDAVFDHYDALLTPATLGTAPAGLESTGDPLMCTLWTLLGLPALSLPLLHGENGLPIGVQLVGRRGDEGRLLRTAAWLVRAVESAAG